MNRLKRNTIFSGIDTIFVIAANLVATPLLIKGLGAEKYGFFVLVSIFSFNGALSFLDLGMEGAIITYVAQWKKKCQTEICQRVLSSTILYYLGLGIMAALAAWISILLIGNFGDDKKIVLFDSGAILLLIPATVVVQFLAVPYSAVLQGLQRYDLAKTGSVLTTGLQLLLIYLAMVGKHQLTAIFVVVFVVNIFRLILYAAFAYWVSKCTMQMKIHRRIFATIWRRSNPLFVNRLIGLVYNTSDRIIISILLPMANLGVYDICMRPATAIKVLGGIGYSSVIPEVSALRASGKTEKILELYQNINRLFSKLLLPISIAIAFNSKPILCYWINESMAKNWPYLIILLLGVTINLYSSIISTFCVGMGLVGKLFYVPTIATIFRLLLGLVLVFKFEVFGLALAFLSAEMLMLAMYYGKFLKELGHRRHFEKKLNLKLLVQSLVIASLYIANTLIEASFFQWVTGFTIITVIYALFVFSEFKQEFKTRSNP